MELPDRFGGRVLPIDAAVADQWGRLLARTEAARTPVDGTDALIAAKALTHRLHVVTRNVAHFTPTYVDILCPWPS